MRIGIDLGGTKIEAVAMDDGGDILYRQRTPTPRDNYAVILRAIADLVERVETTLGQTGSIGIGTPGAASAVDGRMKNCNTTCLNGQALQRDLEALMQRPLRLANDANCFALSEAVDGAGQNASSVFGVIIGTGIGGGLVFSKQLHVGANAIGGEWGHNLMPGADEGRQCYCGRRDCIETYLSGAGLLQSYQRNQGCADNVQGIVADAEAGSERARAQLDDYCEKLARALALVVNTVDPEAIVLGGGLSNIPLLYTKVPELWGKWVFSDQCRTQLLPARYGDSSGVRGAAWLW